jgi:tRNA pseudouridine55 synthase
MTDKTEISRNHRIPAKEEINGDGSIFLVVKPIGWSSFDVVKKIRIHFGVKKVGHAGTLDPLASGLLIIGTGKKTKVISNYSGLNKEYEGMMILGARTASYDAETEVTDNKDFSKINISDIESVFTYYVGRQYQKPPMYSAVKHHGKRLYKYARKGKEVITKEREIQIDELELLKYDAPEVKFRVTCSKGTYVRSLVNDIGDKLGCGAYLKSLTRTRVGPFSIEEAFTIEELILQTN